MRNPTDGPAIQPDMTLLNTAVATVADLVGHSRYRLVFVTGVSIDVFRRLDDGAEIRPPQFATLVQYVRVWGEHAHVTFTDENGRTYPAREFTGTTGELHILPTDSTSPAEKAEDAA